MVPVAPDIVVSASCTLRSTLPFVGRTTYCGRDLVGTGESYPESVAV